MPIQGLDMSKGLEHYCVEHVEGVYKIYTDGNVQTVMGYAGLGDLYNEAMAMIYEEEIARGANIQSKTHITSDINFHRMLVEQLNQDNIAKVEREEAQFLSVRNVLKEEVQPLVMSEQRVITSINFCCRVDLQDGSIYIGEGYENLFYNFEPYTGSLFEVNKQQYGVKIIWKGSSGRNSLNIGRIPTRIAVSENFSISFKTDKEISCINSITTSPSNTLYNSLRFTATSQDELILPRINNFNFTENYTEELDFVIATKTSTHKPFVKTMMPSGKLGFITKASSGTHSFMVKAFESSGSLTRTLWRSWRYERVEYYENEFEPKNILFSEKFANVRIQGKGIYSDTGNLGISGDTDKPNSFFQLLIYLNDERGGMTQAELEGELVKDLKLR